MNQELVTKGTIPRRIDDVGTTIQTSQKEVETSTEPDENDMKMPRDQRLAWDAVDAFRAHYVKLHGRVPRRGVVMKRFDKFLVEARAAIAAEVLS